MAKVYCRVLTTFKIKKNYNGIAIIVNIIEQKLIFEGLQQFQVIKDLRGFR